MHRAAALIGLVGTGTGLFFIYHAGTRGQAVPGLDINQPRHPVTPEMAAEVAKLKKKVAPFFKLKDTDGKEITIGGKGSRPQFVYFVKKGCPCSFDAEPLFQSLQAKYGKTVDFICVTDANPEDARQWDIDLQVPYPVISNSKLDVMKGYKAPASVYNSLIDQQGVIVASWPGYCRSYLQEANQEMSRLVGAKLTPFDTKFAPEEGTSGCSYEN